MPPKGKHKIEVAVGAQSIAEKLFPVWSDAAAGIDKSTSGELDHLNWNFSGCWCPTLYAYP
jgi:hypothetical protein